MEFKSDRNAKFIPVAKPLLPTAEQIAPILRKIDGNRIYSNFGPVNKCLIQAYAKYFCVNENQIVLLSNATLALTGLLELSPIKKWIIPNFTFTATGLAALAARKNLFLTDVCKDCMNLKKSFFPNEFDSNSFGILPVAPFGTQLDYNELLEFEHVIIDAAASIGSIENLKNNLKDSWSIVFSLHATKVYPAPEGSVVICGNTAKAAQLRQWSAFGFDSNRISKYVGTNAKLSEIHAAYALASLDNREIEYLEWKSNLDFAKKSVLNKNNFIDFGPGIRPYWLCRSENSEEKAFLESKLDKHGIGFRNWWEIPLSSMPAFKNEINVKIVSDINSIYLSAVLTGLPMYRDLPKKDISFISEIL